MKPDLIIFDCDGVLIDSEMIACGADAAELTKVGFEISTRDLVRRFAGVPSKDMYATLEAEFGQTLPHDLEERVACTILEKYRTNLRAIPDVHDTIRRLTVPICVASSSNPDKLRLGLSHTNLLKLFEPHVFSTSQVERGKPSPDVFLFSARQLDTTPENCVVIEDSVAGVTAARAAKMRVIGFVGGSHCSTNHGRELANSGAELIFDRFSELPEKIEQLP